MNDALKGYRDMSDKDTSSMTPEEKAQDQRERAEAAANRKAEEEAIRQEQNTLDVDESHGSVPKGDESTPPGQRVSANDRKALYDKAKKNREALISRESESNADVELIREMNEMEARGEDSSKLVDTNKTERGEDHRRLDEAHEARDERGPQEDHEQGLHEDSKDVSANPDPSLTAKPRNDKVTVDILGQRFIVPQQDVDDAGGIEAYQKRRAADIKLLALADHERYLNERWQREVEGQSAQQDAHLSEEDGQGNADVSSLRKELLDIVAEGTNEDIDTFLEGLTKRQRAAVLAPQSPTTSSAPVSEEERVIQDEIARQEQADRIEANRMMREQYPDVLADPELLELSRQRFRSLQADGYNVGRTPKELVREAAEFVRGLGRTSRSRPQHDPVQAQRDQRVTQKRKIPQPSRADDRAPRRGTGEDERKVPGNREHFLRLRRAQGHDL